MKICIKCKIGKDFSEFYKHKQMKDGYLGKCKECTKSDVKRHRDENIDKIREYDRNRPNKEDRIKKSIEYAKTEKGKIVRRSSTANYRERNPLKYQAHNLVNNAVRGGYLIKPNNCSECAVNCNPHGHHDDYSMPLSVRWLCHKCHNSFHKKHELDGFVFKRK